MLPIVVLLLVQGSCRYTHGLCCYVQGAPIITQDDPSGRRTYRHLLVTTYFACSPPCPSLCGGRLLRGQCGSPVQGDGVVGPGPSGALDRPVRGGGGSVGDHGTERRAAGVCAAVVAVEGVGEGVCASKQGGSGAGGMLASLLGDLHKCIT